jgi:hypothetical protein
MEGRGERKRGRKCNGGRWRELKGVGCALTAPRGPGFLPHPAPLAPPTPICTMFTSAFRTESIREELRRRGKDDRGPREELVKRLEKEALGFSIDEEGPLLEVRRTETYDLRVCRGLKEGG